jgi:hypothetical protein
MLKSSFLIAAGLFLFSCSSTPSPETSAPPQQAAVQEEPAKPAPEVLKTATYDQLVGIWKLTEERTHPLEKGTPPRSMNSGIMFGFHENGRFISSSLGMEYMEEALGLLGAEVVVKDGVILSKNGDEMFAEQWGKGLTIYALGPDEMVIQYNILQNSDDKISLFQRVK